MGRYVAKRLLQLVPILLGITLASFLLMRIAGGDAVETMLESVPEMTVLTPLMSVFMRVMISPCFSEVKKAWGMRCRW